MQGPISSDSFKILVGRQPLSERLGWALQPDLGPQFREDGKRFLPPSCRCVMTLTDSPYGPPRVSAVGSILNP
jgi:hypothetical protein